MMKRDIIEFDQGNGTTQWGYFKSHRFILHRDGAPAVVDLKNEDERWYTDGMLNRLDGPAMKWIGIFGKTCYRWYIHDRGYDKFEDYCEEVKKTNI